MKILFKIFPQKSHLNATFPLARRLSELGHEIVYAGVSPLCEHVTAQGFAYHVEDEDIFRYVDDQLEDTKLTLRTMLHLRRMGRGWERAMRARFEEPSPFAATLRLQAPGAMLIDSPYAVFALPLLRSGMPFGIVESMMNLNRAPGCTPLDTTYVPDGNVLCMGVVRYHWCRYFLKRRLFAALRMRLDFSRRFVTRRARAAGISDAAIQWDRYFHPGIAAVPEFILSPQELDLPREPAPNQVYVGPSVLMDRIETAGDYFFGSKFERFVAERRLGRPLVYCSLGTAGWRYPGSEQFLSRVVRAACGQRWNLVVAIGTRSDPSRFAVPDNVGVFQVVPQLRVLRSADLVITHGGMNSITESVLAGVPMLVYPGTRYIDQAGNAARVVFHGIGLLGSMSSESVAGCRRKVSRVLGDAGYSERAKEMGRRIRGSEAWLRGAERVIEALGAQAGAKQAMCGYHRVSACSSARDAGRVL